MTFEIYKLEWILSRHTFGNTTFIIYMSYYFSILSRNWQNAFNGEAIK